MKSGVYVITAPNGKRYVGSAVDFPARWSVHRHHLRAGTHHNRHLQSVSNKYGVDSLEFKRILICVREQVVMYEQIAIDALKPEMNAVPTAGNSYGYRHTDETKAKFHLRRKCSFDSPARLANYAARRGVPLSPEHAAKVQAAKIGKPKSKQARANMSASKTGVKQSAETVAKRRAANIAAWEKKRYLAKTEGVPMRLPQTEAQKAKRRATWAAKRAAKGGQ